MFKALVALVDAEDDGKRRNVPTLMEARERIPSSIRDCAGKKFPKAQEELLRLLAEAEQWRVVPELFELTRRVVNNDVYSEGKLRGTLREIDGAEKRLKGGTARQKFDGEFVEKAQRLLNRMRFMLFKALDERLPDPVVPVAGHYYDKSLRYYRVVAF